MSGRKIVLVEAEDRRRHVLGLARASATAELVADWAEQRPPVAEADDRLPVDGQGSIHLPSLRDFVRPRPPTTG